MINPIDLLADGLRYLIDPCYWLTGNWWAAILLFTLLTKIILMPISLWCQINSIKMVALMPQINRIKAKYFGDKEAIGEAQVALFKKEHYHGFLSIVPLVIQLVILIGLINTIYQITGENPSLEIGLIPFETGGITLLMPIAAGLAAVCLSIAQNHIHPLQKEQTRVEQLFTNGISIGISLVLGIFVPLGVGFYWACSNIFSILVQVACNFIIKPKKHIDYQALEDSRKELAAIDSLDSKKWYVKDENRKREKADYKKFFSVANKHLVFYSENSGYYKYFKNVIEYLLGHSNIIIHYVTNDPDDQIFSIAEEQPRIKPYYIGQKRIITLFMKMDADIVVMTTPDLEKYYLKRSYVRKDIEYIFIDHGPMSIHMCYREGALDYFDTVLCVGQHQIDEIRATERVYGLKEKKLVPCGYGQIDSLLAAYEKQDKEMHEKKIILVAPSYQTDNILDSCLDEVVDQLGCGEYTLIIRPHPQYIKLFPGKIEAMLKKYQNKLSETFKIETDFSSNVTIFTADLVITDWSGIAYEFSYTTKKPSLFINTTMKVVNPNYEKIGLVPIDISLRDKIGVSVNPDNLSSLKETVELLFKKQDTYRTAIYEIMQKYLFNIGDSGKSAGNYILQSEIEKQAHKVNK
ncbi:MAG TPA: YidC/Oxa1 family membrane protein insertase [Methanocorpusculum sp.]|nr:YidC/Oxa1 family membrane protein insertase [Methanocorpusculum sp.]